MNIFDGIHDHDDDDGGVKCCRWITWNDLEHAEE